jgi:hypothetical protein
MSNWVNVGEDIDELTAKLNKTCYATRLVKPSMSSEV